MTEIKLKILEMQPKLTNKSLFSYTYQHWKSVTNPGDRLNSIDSMQKVDTAINSYAVQMNCPISLTHSLKHM